MIEVVRITQGVISKSLRKQAHVEQFLGILSIRKSPESVVLADYCLLIVQLSFQMCIAGRSSVVLLLIHSRYVIQLDAI